MTAATTCSTRPRGFRLGGRISPEISAHGGSFAYARTQIDASAYRPVSDRAWSPPAGSGSARSSAPSAVDIAPSRRFYSGGGGSVRGYGYQQLGPQRRRRRSDRRPRPRRIRARGAHPAEARSAAISGSCRSSTAASLTHRAAARASSDWRSAPGIGVRYYSSFGPIRDRRRHAAQPRRRATAGRGHGLARPGLLDVAEDALSGRSGATPPQRRLRRDWPRRLLNELLALFAGAADPARRRRWCCSTPRPATASSSTGSPASRPRRASTSASAGSTGRSSASRSCKNVAVVRPAAACS